jgi:hypothetical protein
MTPLPCVSAPAAAGSSLRTSSTALGIPSLSSALTPSPAGLPTPPLCAKLAATSASASVPWDPLDSQPPWSLCLGRTKVMRMPRRASSLSGTGACHDHPPRYRGRLCQRVSRPRPSSASLPSKARTRHAKLAQRPLWPPPLAGPNLWGVAPRPALVRPPALSPGSAAYNPAVAPHTTSHTAPRPLLPPLLHRPCAPASARLNPAPPRPCATPLQPLSTGALRRRAVLARPARDSLGSSIPGAGRSSILPTATTASRARSWPHARPVANPCGSSCACGPPTGPLSIPAERRGL